MKTVYLSSFCVDFRDYEKLEKMIRSCSEFSMGVELATSWKHPDFDECLEAQIDRFREMPVTIHSPFVECCVEEGSEEALRMNRSFQKAIRWYHLFGATSMVMHTHSKGCEPQLRAHKQQRSEEVILKVAEKARQEGINLTVENVGYAHKNNVLFNQEEYIALIRRLPEDIGALIDTGHAMANNWDIPKVIEELGPRIRGYHLHNTDGVHDLHRPMFEAGWHYSPEQMDHVVDCIRRFSPDAELILEYSPGEHISSDLFAGEMKRLRSLWPAI